MSSHHWHPRKTQNRLDAQESCKHAVRDLCEPWPVLPPCWFLVCRDTWALLKRLCRIESSPDKSGRLSRAEYPRAPSTDLMATFSVSFASPDCSFLIFREAHSSRHSKKAGCPTRMDPSACTLGYRILLFHFPMPERETFLELGNCMFPDFVSSTSNVVDGHSNDTMVSLL